MTQNELVKMISLDTGMSEDKIKKVLRKLTVYISVGLETDREVQLSFGTIYLKKSNVKEVQDFANNKRFKIASRFKTTMTPSIYIKKTINKMNLREQEAYEKEQRI